MHTNLPGLVSLELEEADASSDGKLSAVPNLLVTILLSGDGYDDPSADQHLYDVSGAVLSVHDADSRLPLWHQRKACRGSVKFPMSLFAMRQEDKVFVKNIAGLTAEQMKALEDMDEFVDSSGTSHFVEIRLLFTADMKALEAMCGLEGHSCIYCGLHELQQNTTERDVLRPQAESKMKFANNLVCWSGVICDYPLHCRLNVAATTLKKLQAHLYNEDQKDRYDALVALLGEVDGGGVRPATALEAAARTLFAHVDVLEKTWTNKLEAKHKLPRSQKLSLEAVKNKIKEGKAIDDDFVDADIAVGVEERAASSAIDKDKVIKHAFVAKAVAYSKGSAGLKELRELIRDRLATTFDQRKWRDVIKDTSVFDLKALATPLSRCDSLQILLRRNRVDVFKKGTPPGLTGRMANALLSQHFWQQIFSQISEKDVYAMKLGIWAGKYRELDMTFCQTDVVSSSEGAVTAAARRIDELVRDFQKWYQVELKGDLYHGSKYVHYLRHAPDLLRIHSAYGIPLGILGSGGHEHHVQFVKRNCRGKMSQALTSQGVPRVVQLMRLQCGDYHPRSRELAARVSSIPKQRAKRKTAEKAHADSVKKRVANDHAAICEEAAQESLRRML